MLRHGTQLGGSRGLGKRAWPERRRPAVLPAVCTLQCAILQCPGALALWSSPESVGCLDDSKRPPKKGPRTGPPARQGPPLACSRGNGAQLQAITNQLSIIVQQTLWP